jgi:hypothetical protein
MRAEPSPRPGMTTPDNSRLTSSLAVPHRTPRLLARVLPMPSLGSNVWFDWDAKRRSLSAFLQLDQNLLDHLQSGIFIVAPLLSAAVSVAIPH